jgi:hypothetical protein
MFSEITFYPVFGVPLIIYGGLLTLSCLVLTAAIPLLNAKGIRLIPIRWHMTLAKITILLALMHGLFGFLAYV